MKYVLLAVAGGLVLSGCTGSLNRTAMANTAGRTISADDQARVRLYQAAGDRSNAYMEQCAREMNAARQRAGSA